MDPSNTTAATMLNGPRATRSARSGKFQCEECHHSFARIEHYTRHARSHVKDRYLKCAVCRKGFYRIDALKRHEQVHTESNQTAKGSRACLACVAARRRCRGEPCSGCLSRGIECRYPDRRRGGGVTEGRVTDSASPRGSLVPLDTLIAVVTTEGEPEHNYEQDPSVELDHATHTPYATVVPYVSLYSQNDIEMQIAISPSTTGLDSFNTSTMANLEAAEIHDDQSQRIGNASHHISMPWFQNSFPSINWLPDNWDPDFQVENLEPNIGPSYAPRNIAQSTSIIFPATSETTISSIQEPEYIHDDESLTHPSRLADLEISSPGSQSAHTTGHFYVDGEGARLPRVRKVPHLIEEEFTPTASSTDELRKGFKFPQMDETRFSGTLTSQEQMPQMVYDEIVRVFSLTCVKSTHYRPFEDTHLPSLRCLNHSIRLYVYNFQSILPFLHPATFDAQSSHWLLLLAMAAVGTHYIGAGQSNLLVLAMHELTRRAIQFVIESEYQPPPDELLLAQANLLNCVGMMYCGDDQLMKSAIANHSNLVLYCKAEWVKPALESNDERVSGVDDAWKAWYQVESCRRTGYCIWLLDCMWAFQFQMRPLLSLEDARIPVPCQEVLWEAESSLDWQQLYDSSTPSPSLHAAIQLAYIEKRLQSSMGEFSRILCIHALFHRTWEVENYLSHPLTRWTPTAEKRDIDTVTLSTPIKLHSIPTYAKWRNSACDVLDILHWHANSIIGAASGMEHPTVMHLHLARVILLTPIKQILHLAHLKTATASPDDLASTTDHVRRWVLEDQHKSRLAVIHAGVLFWHVRRYSVDAFYEPSSVLLATLALWAYGTFVPQVYQTSKLREDTDALFPTAMQLDRPADDELVQLFVKRGAGMRANVTGVGDLCGEGGAGKVLREGRRLLVELGRWGESGRGVGILSALIERC